jgi:hypothetical protein
MFGFLICTLNDVYKEIHRPIASLIKVELIAKNLSSLHLKFLTSIILLVAMRVALPLIYPAPAT